MNGISLSGRGRAVCSLTGLLLLLVIFAGTGWAGGAVVTQGRFEKYLDGEARYDAISGNAVMVRVPAGKTLAKIEVSGLAPNKSYGVHVHEAPCATGGGGHYKHDPAGPGTPPNEIWLGFTSNETGHGSSMGEGPFWAREEAQSIVIHDYSDSARIACVDLLP